MDEGPARLHIETTVGTIKSERLRRLGLRGLGASIAVFTLLGIASIALHTASPCLISVIAQLSGAASIIALLRAGSRAPPRMAPCTVTVEGTAITIGQGSEIIAQIPIASITQGHFEEPDRVHLATASGVTWVITVRSAEEAEALLRAASVTAAERVLRVPLTSAASQIPGGPAFGLIALLLLCPATFFTSLVATVGAKELTHQFSWGSFGAFSIVVGLTAALSAITYAVFGLLRRREALIGTDGIAYQKSLRKQFIPYGSVREVLPDTRGVRLVCTDGRSIVLPTQERTDRPLSFGVTAPGAVPTPAEARRKALMDRIAQAKAAGGGSVLARVALDKLDRNDRPVTRWKLDLQNLAKESADYRNRELSLNDLCAVIEDAGAPPERRIAATVALAGRDKGEAHRRVRIAAQACADEELRRALESAAEGEIEEAYLEKRRSSLK